MFFSIHHRIGIFDFTNNKQCFTLQHCPKTHSIKCYICVHKEEVSNTTLNEQRWKLLDNLEAMIHFVHRRYISTTQKPIAYIKCPLRQCKELHLRLHDIKPNMYCDKVHPKKPVPKKAYDLLLLPMDQLGKYE